jgi:hypothetical protein
MPIFGRLPSVSLSLKIQYYLTSDMLDYIFLLDSSKLLTVIGASEIPESSVLEPGLPRKGLSASDHISLTAEIVVSSQ